MKLLIVLLAIFAFASAGTIDARDATSRSAASQIVDALESLREQMPCGFEKYNIPPLAPLKFEHKQVAVEGEVLSVEGEVNKARVDGIDEFIITDMRVNVVTSKVTFRLDWPSITCRGLYDLEAILKSYGITLDLKGTGNLFLAIRDLSIQGSIKYSLGLISKQIKLKEVKIIVNIGDVDSQIEGILGEGFVNHKLNEILEETILLAVNDNQESITDAIENAILPPVNSAVDGMSLGDLIASIGGGSSDKPQCIPPDN